MSPLDKVRKALQELLDAEGDGWHMGHYVVIMGLEKIGADGEVTTSAWITNPPSQPDYVTDGLITTAQDLRYGIGEEDDD